MSERMIELQRAKLGLPPMAAQPTAATGQSSTATQMSTTQTQQQLAAAHLPQAQQQQHHAAAAVVPPSRRPTPQQAAAAAVHAQETELQKFLHCLQQRQDNQASTVPSALSRRMLQRQSVGYLDDSVASVASATADRFLATVLTQAVACRDQRLKGAEMAREEDLHRRKHILQHAADAEDRKRRRVARREARKKSNLDAIAAAERLKAAGIMPNATTNAAVPSPSKARKKKKKGDNGEKSDDEMSHDSLEEEEEYYKEHYGGADTGNSSDEEEDENQDMLTLRDLERPLEAWDVHLTGKVGLGIVVGESSDVESDDDVEDMEVEMNGTSDQKGAAEDGDEETQPSPAAGKKAASPATKRRSSTPTKTTPPKPKGGRKDTSPAPNKKA